MKNIFVFALGFFIFSSCSQNKIAKPEIIEIPGNQNWGDLANEICMGSNLIAVAESNKLFFFNGLDLIHPTDSFVFHDTIWEFVMKKLPNPNFDTNQYQIQHPDLLESVGFSFPATTIISFNLLEENLAVVFLKHNFLAIKNNVQGTNVAAAYTLFLINVKSKEIINSTEGLIYTNSRDMSNKLSSFYKNKIPVMIYSGMKLEKENGKEILRPTYSFDYIPMKDTTPIKTVFTDTIPIIGSFHEEILHVGVRNALNRYDANGVMMDSTVFPSGWKVCDGRKHKDITYALAYQYDTESASFKTAIFAEGKAEPIFQSDAQIHSYRFFNYQNQVYFIYEKDAVTYAVRF